MKGTAAALLAGLAAVAPAAAGGQAPTFHGEVAEVLYRNCVGCHREGGIGPFSLATPAEAAARAARIAAVTAERRMPPWLPAAGGEPLAGDRRLSEEAIATLRRWAESGAPAGNPAPLPEASGSAAGWQLGEPDLVAAMPEPYRVPASGPDIFRSFVVPVPTDRDRWVRALEFRPGVSGVVHHAVVLVDRARSTRHLDALDPGPGWQGMRAGLAESPDGHFLGWTPGKLTAAVPEGMPWRLARGSDLVLQLHLLPRPEADPVRVEVGFHFAEGPPTRVPSRLRLGSKTIAIPAGEDDYRIRDSYRLPVEAELIGLYPHAHYLGSEMRVWAELPDGRRRPLLHIPRWDFNWQDEYRFARPVALPAGSRLAMEFRYDNSAANPRNPHRPPKRVRYGPESSDEMGDLWVQVVPRRAGDLEALRLDFARKETAARLAGYRFKLAEDPDDEEAHYSLARMRVELGETDRARDHLREALRIRPDFAAAMNDLGRLLLLEGEAGEAAALFRRALDASPGLPEAHHNLGAALLGRGELEAAEAHFRSALREWPEFAEAHYALGEVLESGARADEALRHFREAAAAKPGFALAHFRLGNLLAARGAEAESLRQYDLALEAEPTLLEALFNRAAVLARQGRLEAARAALLRLLETAPDHRRAAELLRRIGEREPPGAPPAADRADGTDQGTGEVTPPPGSDPTSRQK